MVRIETAFGKYFRPEPDKHLYDVLSIGVFAEDQDCALHTYFECDSGFFLEGESFYAMCYPHTGQ